MTRIILNGCSGKMGQVVSRLAATDDTVKIVAGIDINAYIENPYPVYTNYNDCKEEADVIIDFSHPSALEGLTEFAKRRRLPIVVATTGLSEEQKNKLFSAKNELAIFFSANMSLGINLLIELSKKAARLLGDRFDIEIVEKHHNQKIDAPSGTAMAIADALSDSASEPLEYVYDRHRVRRKRKKNEIGIHAIRGGTIVGEHDVIFAGSDEVITISHSAASKEIFASGAIKAAEFMSGKKSGLYNMSDIIEKL